MRSICATSINPRYPAALDELCLVERDAGIRLTTAPISRFVLARIGDDCWHFVWNFHHIVLDGWSTVRVFDEAFEFYRDDNAEHATPPAFRNHLAWLAGQEQPASEEYWRRTLAGFDAPTQLQLGMGSSEHAFDAARIPHTIDASRSNDLKTFAKASRVTLNTLIQAAWGVVLTRYAAEEDVVFGVTISGRPSDLDGVEDMIGMFLNTLPMRLRPPSRGTVGEWLNAVQLQQQDINTHHHSSLAEVQRWSEVPAGEALFESILVFENYPTGSSPSTDGFTVERRAVFEQSHYPLSVLVGGAERLSFLALYDRSKFSPDMVAQLLRHVENVLVAMLDGAGVAPDRLEILAADEQQMILEEWNDTTVDLGPAVTLGELLADQAAATPDGIALIFGDRTMTYEELDQRSNRLANRLVDRGVGPEIPVGISMFRGFEMVIGVLATVKAGGVYVPLDPAYPEDRIALIANDAGVDLILTHSRARSSVPDCGADVIDIDDVADEVWSTDSPPLTVNPDNSVLLTFTSGSTGRPKGVQAHHRGIVDRIRWQWKQYPLGADEVCCQKTTLNFADHLWELWGSLLGGSPQVLVPEDVVVDTPKFLALLADHKIERIVLVPSYIRALLDAHPDLADRLPDLRYWTFSGEGVSRSLADRFRAEMPHAVLLNFYGMSEVTLDATVYDDRWGIDCETVPIGRPIANQRVYLLDDLGRLAPVGVIANIHVSGVGLSRGYWGKDDLTEASFGPHPFLEGGRIYRTGDHGRWLPSGDVEYLGRSDSQVKVRGFRVELGEVEAAIRSHRAVRECVVMVEHHLGYNRLLAYVLPTVATTEDQESTSVLIGEVTDHVRALLPTYMVPAVMMLLDDFPRTPNGKLDRLALPAPAEAVAHARPVVEATTDDEARMLRLWSDTLEISVGLDDDFFDAGGHSLIALRLVARIAREFDRELPLAAFFEAPTPRTLSRYLVRGDDQGEWVHLVPISSGRPERPNIFCIHGAGGNVLNFQSLGSYFEGEWSLVGLQASGVDGLREMHQTMDEFCDAYITEMMAYQPEGPYILAGYSAGGVIAYEIANRFVAQGRDVLAVVFLDTFHPALRRAKAPTLRRSLSILASGPAYAAARVKEQRVRRHAIRSLSSLDRTGEEKEPMPLESRGGQLRLNTVAALSAYTPPTYDGCVILFGASRIDWAFERYGELRGWDFIAPKSRVLRDPRPPSRPHSRLERSRACRHHDSAPDGSHRELFLCVEATDQLAQLRQLSRVEA